MSLTPLLHDLFPVSVVSIKKRNEDHLQSKIAKHASREQAIKEAQEKAAREREERKEKISRSRKIIEDAKRALVEEKKQTSVLFERIVVENKMQEEMEKKVRAEDEKRK